MKHSLISLSLGLFLLGGVACQELSAPTQSAENSAVEFQNLRIEDLSDTSAAVKFTTSQETTCEAQYGTDKANLNLTQPQIP